MFFNSLSFVWLFVPAALVGFYVVVPRHWRRSFLLAMSLLFYAFSGPAYLLMLLADIAWVHAVTRSARYPGNTRRMWLAIAVPIGLLVYFKYLTFVLEDALGLPPSLFEGTIFANILLPVGISFFTFELISYALDRYRGAISKPASFADFALFVTFFPHLIAGPILRYGSVADQFAALPAFRLSAQESQEALIQICIGFALKILLADWLAAHIAVLKDDPGGLSGPAALFLVFGFSFQIYFDFFGYSLIAIGLGRLFGIRLPDNFERPYEALNPRQFWRRWHISLSFWLRDYLYFPLGGNNSYVRNILIVFVVCGVWHGAGWRFAIWGLTHALLVIGYHYTALVWDRWPGAVQRGVTFVLVSFAWLPFLLDVAQCGQVLRSLAVWSSGRGVGGEAWLALAIAALGCVAGDPDRVQRLLRRGVAFQALGGMAAALLLIVSLSFFDRTATFIYFRF